MMERLIASGMDQNTAKDMAKIKEGIFNIPVIKLLYANSKALNNKSNIQEKPCF